MLDDFLKPAPDQVLQVTDLTRQIKQQLEGRFTQFWVQGEVSNLRRQSSGHVYFSLKDRNSQLPAVLFARDAMRQSVQLEDGMEVLLLGGLSVYEPHGRYQMIAKIAIQSGEGRLQIEFERLKRKLAAEGLFDSERKRPLPVFPKRIAVITSPTGAAIQDFLRILRRRNYGGEVVIFPARVQGKEAALELKAMLTHANASKDFDLVVLTRGGGSIEDLWPFNDEALAREVADSRLPVISAVGHEIDHVLTDYAADARAETPSGAAELISSAFLEIQQRFTDASESLLSYAQSHLYEYQVHLRDLNARLQLIAPDRRLQVMAMQLDDLENKLERGITNHLQRQRDYTRELAHRLTEHNPRNLLKMSAQHTADLDRRLQQAVIVNMSRHNRQMGYLEKRLSNSSVQATLNRGYALLQKSDGDIVTDTGQVQKGDAVSARLSDGQIQLEVKE